MDTRAHSGAGEAPAVGPQHRQSTPAARHRPWLRWALWLTAWPALLGGAAAVAGAVPVEPVLGYALAFGVVAAQTLCVAWAAPTPSRTQLRLIVVPIAVVYAVYLGGASGVAAAMIVTAGLLAAGTLLGAAIGAGIEHPGHLLFVALISSGMDALSVLHPRGLSAALVKSEAALSALAMSWPLLGTDAIAPILGVGDVVFAALYVAASRAHGLPLTRTLWALSLAFFATLCLVIAVEIPVPALPLLGLAIVAAHPQARRPRASDRRAGWVGVGLLVIVGVVLFLTR